MKRIIVFILMISFLSLMLTGCWGKREVEQLGFVFAIGIDKGEQDGTYKVTYQIAKPKKGGDGGGDIDNFTITVEARTMREGMERVYEIFSKQPFLGTTKVLVLGKGVAEEGINAVLDFFQRYYEFRRTVYLVLAKGEAKDILNIKLRFEKLSSMSLIATLEQKEMFSNFPVVRLGHYLTVLATESTAPIIPVVSGVKTGMAGVEYKPENSEGEKPEELEIKGSGVFDGDRLVEYLNIQETKGYMWLQNEVDQRLISTRLSDEPNSFASGRIIKSKTKYKLVPTDKGYGINYNIEATFDLDEILLEQKKRTPKEWLDTAMIVKPAFENVIQEECLAALAKSRELKLDFLGLGRNIEEKKPKYWRAVKDNWEEIMPTIPVTIEVEVIAENAGSSFNPPTNPSGSRQQ